MIGFKKVLFVAVMLPAAAQGQFAGLGNLFSNGFLESLLALFRVFSFGGLFNFGGPTSIGSKGRIPLFEKTNAEIQLSKFTNEKFGGTAGAFELIGKGVFDILMNYMDTNQDCGSLFTREAPTLEVTELGDSLPGFFDLLSFNSCSLNVFGAPETFIEDNFVNPFVEFWTALEENASSDTRRRRKLEEANRKLQTPAANQMCTTRLEEGSFGGTLQQPTEDAPNERTPGVNQYAWSINFNDDLGLGVVVHSLGSGGALLNRYTLPTFTVRDKDANIVFQGSLAEPVQDDDVNAGFRASIVTDVTGSIITVIAVSVGVPEGIIQEFKFDTNDFDGTNPVSGLLPTRKFDIESPSVRSIEIVDENLLVYAPTFDIGGEQDFGFFRFFDLFQFANTGPRIFPTSDGDRLPGILWDFECAKTGLCFLNTIAFDFGVPEVFFDEDSVPTTSYFAFSDFPTEVVGYPVNGEAEFAVTVVENTFDIEYSAQSFEPISVASSVVCTLSGFLFRGGSIISNPDAEVLDFGVLPDLSDFSTVLDFFELGNPQQCEVCTGTTSPQPSSGLTPDSCESIPIVGQPSTTAYVWAVEECGGKVWIGTYDIGSVLSEIIIDVFVIATSFLVCQRPAAVNIACRINPFLCTDDQDANRQVCEDVVQIAIENALPVTLRTFAATELATALIGEPVLPNGIGFDLYYAEVSDVLAGTAQFLPFTQNGFRELAPPRFEPNPILKNFFGFEPSSQVDEAVRNLACQRSEDGDSLIVGSAVFRQDATSNTFVVDTECMSVV